MNKLRKYRFLSMLLVIALVFGMLPEHVQAARETDPYDRYQNGREPGGNLVDSWDSNGLNFELYDNGHAYYWSYYVCFDDPGCDYDSIPNDTMITKKSTEGYLDSIREVTIGDYDDTGSSSYFDPYLSNPDLNHSDKVYKNGVFCVTGFDGAPLLEKATLYISRNMIDSTNQYGDEFICYEYLPANAFAYCPNLKKVYLVPVNYHKGDLTFLNETVGEFSRPAINPKAFEGDTLDIVVPMLCGLTMESPVVKQFNRNANITWVYDMDYDNNNNLLAANGGNIQVRFQMDGTLIISGNGDMVDFPEMEDMPWNAAKDKVREVIVEDGVTGIGKNAFKMCTNLEKVTLADSVTKIGDGAFEGCVSLTDVQWSSSLKSIGSRAFHSTHFRNVSLPMKLEFIGEKAFYNCDNMSSMDVPSSVKHIGSLAFGFNASHTLTITFNGSDFTVDGTVVEVPAAYRITIKYPADIWAEGMKESISGDCYDNIVWESLPQKGACGDTLSWTFADGILTLTGYGNIPNYTRVSRAPWYALRDQIHYVELPSNLTGIGDYAFANCDLYMVDIPAAVTSIGTGAFNSEHNLVYVFFNGRPEKIGTCFTNVDSCDIYYQTDIGWDETNMLDYGGTNMYWEANGGKCGDNLTWGIRRDGGTILTISGTGDMYDYDDATTCPWNQYYVHELYLGDGITHIGNNAFRGQVMESVVLPRQLESVGKGAFEACEKLTSVAFNNKCKSIGNAAFRGCKNLNEIILPDSITSIGTTAFGNCEAMKNVKLPGALVKIDQNTFINCKALTEIEIPSVVTSIEMSAFSGCSALQKVTMEDSSLKSIGRNAFSSCTSLKEIRIPESVTSIGIQAFSNNTALKTIYLENTLQTIKSSAFNGCTIRDIYYNGTLEEWEETEIDNSLGGNDSLYSVQWIAFSNGTCGDNVTWTYDFDTYELRLSGFGKTYDYLNEKGGNHTPWFDWSTLIYSIVVEPGITGLGDGLFYEVYFPTKVTLPEGLETIGDRTFYRVLSKNLSIPSTVKKIGKEAFYYTEYVKEYVLPEGITEIPEGAFRKISALEGITLSSNLISIGKDAFAETPNLARVSYSGSRTQWEEISEPDGENSLHSRIDSGKIILDCITLDYGSCGDGVNWMVSDQYDFNRDGQQDICLIISGDGAMKDFTGAGPWADPAIRKCSYIQIGEGVTYIGANAFKNMGYISAVALPKSLTKVGTDAFAGCTVQDAAYADSVYEYMKLDLTTGNDALKNAKMTFNWSTEKAVHTVRFNMNGHGVQVPSQSIEAGRKAAAPADPAAEGYTFCGWYSDSSMTKQYDFNTPMSANVQLYAKWASALAITGQPGDVVANVGEPATFQVSAQGTGLTYQWQYLLPGTTDWKDSRTKAASTQKFTFTVGTDATLNGRKYRCIVKDKEGRIGISNAATLTVSSIKITSHPKDVTAKTGEQISFAVTASGNSLNYQWQYLLPGTTDWKNSGAKAAKSPTFTFTVGTDKSLNGRRYRCLITGDNGKSSVYSNEATLTISSVKITSQPKDVTAQQGEKVTFSVAAEGNVSGYQWQYLLPGTQDWKDSGVKAAKAADFSFVVGTDKSLNGRQYRCKLTCSDGSVLYSDAATLKVEEIVKTVITSQPADVKAKAGEPATFSVTATGNIIEYQWQYLLPGSQDWKNSGAKAAKSATFTFTVGTDASLDKRQYRCKITDAVGQVVYSDPATLRTTDDAPAIVFTTQPADVTAAVGEPVSFTVAATGEIVDYQWQYLLPTESQWRNSGIKSAKSATMTFTVSDSSNMNGRQYRCVVTDKNGVTANSNAATLTVTE